MAVVPSTRRGTKLKGKVNSCALVMGRGASAAASKADAMQRVLVWTASHPHGLMALSASQKDERKV